MSTPMPWAASSWKADVEGRVLAQKQCPRCDAVGQVFRASGARPKPGEYVIVWFKGENFWSQDTCLSSVDVLDPDFGCGYDLGWTP